MIGCVAIFGCIIFAVFSFDLKANELAVCPPEKFQFGCYGYVVSGDSESQEISSDRFARIFVGHVKLGSEGAYKDNPFLGYLPSKLGSYRFSVIVDEIVKGVPNFYDVEFEPFISNQICGPVLNPDEILDSKNFAVSASYSAIKMSHYYGSLINPLVSQDLCFLVLRVELLWPEGFSKNRLEFIHPNEQYVFFLNTVKNKVSMAEYFDVVPLGRWLNSGNKLTSKKGVPL